MSEEKFRVILEFKNEKFATIEDAEINGEEPNENAANRISDTKIGTVIYVAGLIDGNPDELMPFGSEDGKDFRYCLHDRFLEFDAAWSAAVAAVRKESDDG